MCREIVAAQHGSRVGAQGVLGLEVAHLLQRLLKLRVHAVSSVGAEAATRRHPRIQRTACKAKVADALGRRRAVIRAPRWSLEAAAGCSHCRGVVLRYAGRCTPRVSNVVAEAATVAVRSSVIDAVIHTSGRPESAAGGSRPSRNPQCSAASAVLSHRIRKHAAWKQGGRSTR